MCPLVIIILIISTIAAQVDRRNLTVLVNTFVPASKRYIFSRQYVEPAIHYALEQVGPGKRDLVPPWIKLEYRYNDSDCNDLEPVMAGMEVYYGRGNAALVFLGPVCDYAGLFLRLMSRYDYAIITPGAIHHYFGENKSNLPRPKYNTLVRVGATLNTLSYAVAAILSHYRWRHVRILTPQYDSFQEVIPKTCYHINEAFTKLLIHISETTNWFSSSITLVSNILPRDLTPGVIDGVLRTDVGTEFEGRSHILTMSIDESLNEYRYIKHSDFPILEAFKNTYFRWRVEPIAHP